MQTQATVLVHPAARARTSFARRAASGLPAAPLLAVALVAFGAMFVVVALVVAVLAAPLAAALLLLLAWSSRRPGRHARSLARIRTRLRARARGLVVLSGAQRPAAVRAVR